ncbi:Embryo sac development arrest 7, putative [Theobroma cacao]|uniref:Embryo sac development arrest 7, putative n=1 Tax=Theobroma cacao TaxID=3641 RepID=A0A061EV76_THECC|nr:Embryo sac development arrest 7, putative [Theobroma cacao]
MPIETPQGLASASASPHRSLALVESHSHVVARTSGALKSYLRRYFTEHLPPEWKTREEKYDREEDEEVEVEEKESAKRGSIEKPQGKAPDEEEEEDESGAHELVGIPIAPNDQITKKAGVIFVLEKASLEVAKVGKSFQLLNSDDYANFLRKNKKNPVDYRPDISHQVLADDYSKLAFLCADHSVNLHAKYGERYSLRIPRMGRDIAYDCWSCDLLCAASSPYLYRINLEQGRFLSSLNIQSPALNVVSRRFLWNHAPWISCLWCEDGAVECFDMRMRSSIGRINAVSPAGDADEEVTAIDFVENGGFLMGVGSSAGKVMIYDLRSSSPIRVKDHMYDCHIVKIWDPETGEGMTSIKPTGGAINDICVFNDSGLMLLALDSSQIPAYFIPALGPVPKWCS